MKYFKQSAEELREFLEFMEEDIENVKRAVEAVEQEGIDAEFMVHAKSETAEESAENMDMKPENIIKTLVFIGEEPVAVLCPGNKRVSEEKLEEVLGSEVRMADPSEVTEATGYIVGGVSPFDLDIKVLMEESILAGDNVKPAAGSRVVGVEISPEELRKVSDAEVVDLTE